MNQRVRKLSILMPVYNEVRTLRRIIDAILSVQLPCDRELIIVDDGSSDGSREILRKAAEEHANVIVHFHERNQGKGGDSSRNAESNRQGVLEAGIPIPCQPKGYRSKPGEADHKSN